MAAEAWPISFLRIDSKNELLSLSIAKYASSNGDFALWGTPGAHPLTVKEALAAFPKWGGLGQEIVELYCGIFSRVARTVKVAFPAYLLPNGERLLLDGVHRAIAIARTGLQFEINLVTIEGPIEESALPDLRHWTPG